MAVPLLAAIGRQVATYVAKDVARDLADPRKLLRNLRPTTKLNRMFFDQEKVQKALSRARRKALSKVGALVRKRAQRSMRYRNKPSAPGQPPSAHKSKQLAALKRMKRAKHNGALLRELLFYGYDTAAGSVVVGPLGFKGSDAPKLHEFGGSKAGGGRTIWIKAGRKPKGGVERDGLTKVTLNGSVRYPARPFMRPALDAVVPKMAEQFRNTVGG
jgi:hypothetical protein